MLARHRRIVRACAVAFVPDLKDAGADAWRDIETTMEHALSMRPARVRRQLGLLLRAIDTLARIRFASRLDALPLPERQRFLESLQRSRVLLIRRGIWGLRTLVLMGHYTRPSIMHEIGYRADPRGWTARRTVVDADGATG